MRKHNKFLLVFCMGLLVVQSILVAGQRLPVVGGDSNSWGTVLNTYLNVSLNESGELRSNSVSSVQVVDGSITDTDISNETNLTLGAKITFNLGAIIDNVVNGWVSLTGNVNVTQNLHVTGNSTIAGDVAVTGNVSSYWFEGNVNWSYIQNSPTYIQNDTQGWALHFVTLNSNNWTNVTITESQIRNLQAYIANDSNINIASINTSAATIHGNLNVTGISSLGSIVINADNITTNVVASKDGNVSIYNNTGSEHMRLTHDGKMGIGTSRPSERLNVSGNIGASGNISARYFFGIGSQLTSLSEAQISDLAHTVNDTSISIATINATAATIHGNLNVTGTSYLGSITIDADNITTNVVASKDGNVSIYNSTGSEHMRLTHDGKMGIGTTTPSTTLEVVGDIVSAGTSWTSRNSAADNNWRAIVYGNGMFVAVTDSDTVSKIMTSPDGINWTSRTIATEGCCADIAYGNGLFVAVGANSTISSSDGVVWVNHTPSARLYWSSIAYGNGMFVAVNNIATNGITMSSPDGKTWSNRSAASRNNWRAVTYGNGLFVAVADIAIGGSGSYKVMTSPDGITWTNRTSASSNQWTGVTYGNGQFVAVAVSGTGNRIMSSIDGITWTNRSSAANNNWLGVTYGAGLFVAVAETGSGNRIMTSPDGINWKTRASAADNDWQDVTYENGVFVAVAGSGTANRVMTSGKSQKHIIPHDNIYQGKIELRGDLNVTGVSYLGNIRIDADNLTTNIVASKEGNITFVNGSGSEHIRITEDGKVGIGTSNPSEKLNVSGNIGANGNVSAMYVFGIGSQLTNLTESQIRDLDHTVNGTSINVFDINASSATIHGNLNVTGTSYLGSVTIDADNITTNVIASKDGNITFYNDSAAEIVRITRDGKLGIGSANLLGTLHVKGPDIATPGSENSKTLSLYIGAGSGAALGIGYSSSSHSYIQSYGDKPLIINNAGNFVGIGALTNPAAPLHIVVADNAPGVHLENTGGTTDKREYSIYGAGQTLAIGAYNDASVYQRTLIEFDHDGGISLPNLGSVTDVRTVCATAGGTLELKDGACSGSSRRFKENERLLAYGMQELMQLEPKFFNYKTHSNLSGDLEYLGSRTKRRIGLMAEDVYEILPEVVVVEDGIIDSVDYSNLIPLTIKAIQEQQKQITALTSNQMSSTAHIISTNGEPQLQTVGSVTGSNKTRFIDIVVDGIAEIKGAIFPNHVSLSEDTVGHAIITPGNTEVQISFNTMYENTPIVTLTPLDFIEGQYKLTKKTKHGFTIVLQNVQSQDIAFDWHAFTSTKEVSITRSHNTITKNEKQIEVINPIDESHFHLEENTHIGRNMTENYTAIVNATDETKDGTTLS